MKKKKLYIAYGSNMDFTQMQARCPEAEFLGVGVLKGWGLLFKGSKTGSYATIEREKDTTVPVMLWAVSRGDEVRLDRYEGFPAFYYKKTITVEDVVGVNGKRPLKAKTRGMVYIMHEERELGLPTIRYYDVLEKAYRLFGFDMGILEGALLCSAPALRED